MTNKMRTPASFIIEALSAMSLGRSAEMSDKHQEVII
jgi:hypothetical protein